ncbi:MAG TPA: PDZ domain-containing protein [Acidimicrobiia bacterium]
MEQVVSSPRVARRWPGAVAALLILLAGLSLIAWSFRLPYYAFSGGPVSDVVSSVNVSGADTFSTDGSLLMLTVSSQEVNPFEALVAGFDPDVDLVARDAVRPPDESDEDFNARNRASMDLSKETAITLALTRLGYDVTSESDGVLVASVVEGTPAFDVLLANDVIVAVNGVPVELPDDIGSVLEGMQAGDQIEIELTRAGERMTVTVELAERDDDPATPMIGISAAASNPRFEYPFPIEIDAGLVGGPSAGMMYALGVLEVLTADDLTGGHIVAGTGTIDSNGRVGAIGGVRQKVVAAEAAGAEVMLVPASNYEEALTARRERMELVPVATLDEALAALAAISPPRQRGEGTTSEASGEGGGPTTWEQVVRGAGREVS